ncbi:MAG: phage portal protein, partial [Bacteroidaceae bacterium]|nr:phage portal protein [Bacteroidaceae bacterium]
LHSQCEELKVGHEFQEPFGEDIADDLNNIIRAVDAGILSTESGIELNPLVKDSHRESERLQEEQEERQRQQESIFGMGGDGGAASFSDGSKNGSQSEDDDDDGETIAKKKKTAQNAGK